MKFKTTPVYIPLYGYGLECVGNIALEPHVTGTFAADPITGTDGTLFGVFTVADDGSFPSHWSGTYRINVDRLKVCSPDVFEGV